MQLRSLRARLTAAVTAAFAVWMLVICAVLIGYMHNGTRSRARTELTLMAATLRDHLAEVRSERPGMESLLLAEFIEQQRHELATEGMVVFVVDANGAVLEQSQRLIPKWPLEHRDDDWQAIALPQGNRTVVLALHWGRSERVLREQALVLLALSLCAIAAVACVSWFLIRRTLSPISQLSHQATVASTDTLYPQLIAPSEDAEIIGLVGTLNDLLSRLGEAAVVKGRFYAAASHELRTPLQALSGHLEVALSRDRSAEDYRVALDEALSQTKRLISLVRDLLLLNQLDTAAAPPPGELVSVADLCERAVQHLASLAAERDLHVELDLEGEGEIVAPPTHADMLIRNIVDNAVKYASPGGDVRLRLREIATGVEVTIFNTAPGEPKLDTTALFEPFFRPEAARSSSAGNGLGLAICKAIALANSWELRLDQDAEGVLVTAVFGHAERTSPKA
ncbi:MAG: ATP-binding protein [Bacteroidota bacterium]